MLIKEDYLHQTSRLVIKFGYLKEVPLRMLRRNLRIKCLDLLKLLRKLVHLLINLNSQVICVVILFFIKKKNINLTTDTFDKVPEKIVDMRKYGGKNRFLVSWKGLDSNEDTWIDEDQIYDKQLIQEYYRRSKKNRSNIEEDSLSDNEIYIRHRHQPF
eukprot:jgi/Orpsp1_1/1176935/evm.model.c7180000059551.1